MSCIERKIQLSSRYNAISESFEALDDDNMCVMSAEAGERPADRQLCETQDCPFYLPSMWGMVRLSSPYLITMH